MNNMTHRQLAELMASGWGEWMHNPSNSGVVYTTYKYVVTDADSPIGRNVEGQEIIVRKFSETSWNLPTEDVYNRAKMDRRISNIMGF